MKLLDEIWTSVRPFITVALLLGLHSSASLVLYPTQTDTKGSLCSLQQETENKIKSVISVKVTVQYDREELAKIIFSFVYISNLIMFSSFLGMYFIS